MSYLSRVPMNIQFPKAKLTVRRMFTVRGGKMLLLLPACLAILAFALAGPAQDHQCKLWFYTYNSAKQLDSEKEPTPQLLGEFYIDDPSEGRRENRSFPIKGSNLTVFVQMLYDDNMDYYDEYFHDSIKMTFFVSPNDKPTMSKAVAVSTAQVEHTAEFREVIFGTLVPYRGKWFDVWMMCRVKDLEKEKKEKEKQKRESSGN